MLGSLLAVGRTSEVFRYGNDAVAKVLNAGVPEHWAAVEASLTESVRALGVPAPEVLDVTTVEGRPTVVLEYIAGPSMWQLMSDDRAATATLVVQLAQIQRQIHAAGVPDRLPRLVERLCNKIAEVELIAASERAQATAMALSLPNGAALLHGDLHPGNIVMGTNGPVVIDWFDASVGYPAADVVRSALLIGADDLTDRRHLPGATDEHLRELQTAYLGEMDDILRSSNDRLDAWHAIMALSRLAERTGDDTSVLVDRWERFRSRVTASSTSG